MSSQMISLSMMRFEAGPLMTVEAEPDQPRGQVVSDEAPMEMDLMLSLIAEPEPIVLDEYRDRAPERLAG